ncbi:hypothetical protein BvCmsKSP026_04996 [Escherichia coli]|nr:hypothetical protein BvCmsKSP026_04996 [Escherichia coli]GDL01348.1 hypothetical protein BvCmsKSP002_01855 [Escherichia coli]GDP55788.1 hypothetical protein BvCmsNSP070_01397 [Escherichia coli]
MSLLLEFQARHTPDVHVKLCGFDGDLYVLPAQLHAMVAHVLAEEYIPQGPFQSRVSRLSEERHSCQFPQSPLIWI